MAQMKWQNGVLVCREGDCVDTRIVGSRDLAVSRAVSQDRKEFQPDPKLTHPSDRRSDLYEVLY